jgi:cytochrome oxidase Cu insertion factor (SCO1/SenC/PrrC family)
MFQRVLATFVFGSALMLGLLAWPTRVPASTTASDLRKTAANFNLNHSNGNPVTLSDYQGRVCLA